jgi:cleavage and polyadenylation specificity factor subunit 2
MMEWLGGTVSKEDVGEEGTGGRQQQKRKRDDGNDEDALGAFALRFKLVFYFLYGEKAYEPLAAT